MSDTIPTTAAAVRCISLAIALETTAPQGIDELCSPHKPEKARPDSAEETDDDRLRCP